MASSPLVCPGTMACVTISLTSLSCEVDATLQDIARGLNFQRLGLRTLAAALLSTRLAKGETMHNWQQMNLTPAYVIPPLSLGFLVPGSLFSLCWVQSDGCLTTIASCAGWFAMQRQTRLFHGTFTNGCRTFISDARSSLPTPHRNASVLRLRRRTACADCDEQPFFNNSFTSRAQCK